MIVSETFYSIQGEGTLSGMPSFFVRTAGCNLRCRWCDSKYAAWEAHGKELSVDDIVSEAIRYPSRFCVITGGEPMLAPDIHDLARRLRAVEKHITIETAATFPPRGIACSLASLSPKLSNSLPGEAVSAALRQRHERLRLQPDVIRDWLDHYDCQLKFVICNGSDIEELLNLLAGLHCTISPEKVLLMPECIDNQPAEALKDVIVSACKAHGFRYCDRLHIRLFGNVRGT